MLLAAGEDEEADEDMMVLDDEDEEEFLRYQEQKAAFQRIQRLALANAAMMQPVDAAVPQQVVQRLEAIKQAFEEENRKLHAQIALQKEAMERQFKVQEDLVWRLSVRAAADPHETQSLREEVARLRGIVETNAKSSLSLSQSPPAAVLCTPPPPRPRSLPGQGQLEHSTTPPVLHAPVPTTASKATPSPLPLPVSPSPSPPQQQQPQPRSPHRASPIQAAVTLSAIPMSQELAAAAR
jgi:rRNA-processing protein FCF1